MFNQLILYACLAVADKDRYMCYKTLEQAGTQCSVKQYMDDYEGKWRSKMDRKLNDIEEPYKNMLMSYVPKDKTVITAATIVYILAIKRELTVSSPVHPFCDALDISGSYSSIRFGFKWNLR